MSNTKEETDIYFKCDTLAATLLTSSCDLNRSQKRTKLNFIGAPIQCSVCEGWKVVGHTFIDKKDFEKKSYEDLARFTQEDENRRRECHTFLWKNIRSYDGE